MLFSSKICKHYKKSIFPKDYIKKEIRNNKKYLISAMLANTLFYNFLLFGILCFS